MEFQGYEQIRHPLLIDLILEQVFKNLENNALLNSRLVCREWLKISSTFFKTQEANISVLNGDDLFSFLSTFINCISPPRINVKLNFWGIPENDLELFFNTCSHFIKGISITSGNKVDLVSTFSTLLRFIPQIETLTFEGLREMITNQVSRSVSTYLRFEIGVNRIDEFISWYEHESRSNTSTPHHPESTILFPNLKKLNITIQLEAQSPDVSFAFFTILFKIMPGIKSLQVSSLDMSPENTTMPGLTRALQQSRIISHLEELRIDDIDNDGIEQLVQLSSQCGLRLKKLGLHALMHNVGGSVVESLIRSQAENLEELTIGGQYCRGGNENSLNGLTWPFVMPELRILNFVGGMYIGSHFEYIKTMPWSNLEYCRQLPKIQQLGLMYLTNYSMNCIFPDTFEGIITAPCFTLRKIFFAGGAEAIAENKVGILAKLFPNVCELIVTVRSSESIERAFRSWPKLEYLAINIVGNIPKIDETFTGFQVDRCANTGNKTEEILNEHGDEFFEFQEDKESDLSGILNLQDLSTLIIHYQEPSRFPASRFHAVNSFPSDITGMAALRMLKKLKHLWISHSVMTKKCLQILNEELQLESCSVGDTNGRAISFVD